MGDKNDIFFEEQSQYHIHWFAIISLITNLYKTSLWWILQRVSNVLKNGFWSPNHSPANILCFLINLENKESSQLYWGSTGHRENFAQVTPLDYSNMSPAHVLRARPSHVVFKSFVSHPVLLYCSPSLLRSLFFSNIFTCCILYF